MNYSLASLAVELLLIAGAWLAVGFSVREHRQACWSWAWGWLMIGSAALLMFARPLSPVLALDIPINFLLLSAFLQIHRGLAHMARQSQHPAYMLLTYVGLFLIELLRWWFPGNNSLLAWVFAFTLAVPVSGIVLQLWRNAPEWFRRRRFGLMMLAMPPVLTVLVLMLRAWRMGASAGSEGFQFEAATAFIIGTTTAFQVFLALFNYSLFSLVLGSLIQRLHKLSTQDQLTGLGNRRVMLEQLDSTHTDFLRDGQSYALVMMDLDHFKQVNDRLGHLAGDKALRTIARRLRGAMRDGDHIARLGGDDFLLLLPRTDLALACKQAEHIRAAVAGEPISTSRGALSVSLSMGVTVARQVDVDSTGALARVDTALQQARSQGRNCLRVA